MGDGITPPFPLIAGIDLAGSPRRPTGVCLLQNMVATTGVVYENREILAWLQERRPILVAIDAPLSLPPGRSSIEERSNRHFRPCDEELRRRGIPFFPITLGPMRVLTERGILLKGKMEAMGIRVIEVYPGGAQDIWGIPRARRNLAGLRRGLEKLGLKGLKKTATADELDATTAALVGLYFFEGKAEIFGDPQRGAIIMPATKNL